MIQVPKRIIKPDGFPQFVPCWDEAIGTGMLGMFWCPKGHCGMLATHTAAPDGTLSPSLVCPREGCGFHESVRLLDWSPPAARTNQPRNE